MLDSVHFTRIFIISHDQYKMNNAAAHRLWLRINE